MWWWMAVEQDKQVYNTVATTATDRSLDRHLDPNNPNYLSLIRKHDKAVPLSSQIKSTPHMHYSKQSMRHYGGGVL